MQTRQRRCAPNHKPHALQNARQREQSRRAVKQGRTDANGEIALGRDFVPDDVCVTGAVNQARTGFYNLNQPLARPLLRGIVNGAGIAAGGAVQNFAHFADRLSGTVALAQAQIADFLGEMLRQAQGGKIRVRTHPIDVGSARREVKLRRKGRLTRLPSVHVIASINLERERHLLVD